MSKIPVPLTTGNQANVLMDRKRRSAEDPTSPNAKRRVTSSDTKDTKAVDVARASVDESFREIIAQTGMTPLEILEKKLSFKKSTRADDKLKEILPLLKQLRAVGWCLIEEKNECLQHKAQVDQQLHDVQARLERKEADWAARQERNEEYVQQINELVRSLESEKAALQSETEACLASIAAKDQEIARLEALVTSTQEQLNVALRHIAEKDSKCRELEGVVQQAQAYSATLQQYNTTLQTDLTAAKEHGNDLLSQRDSLQQQLATAAGTEASLTSLLNVEKEQVFKLREDRETAARDVAVLRGDLEATRQERDRLAADAAALREEVERHKATGSKTLSKADSLAQENGELFAKTTAQADMLEQLRTQLAQERAQRSMTDDTASRCMADNERLKAEVAALAMALEEAAAKIHASDATRRKLHNVIQDLKGNIRVFCRVRPQPSSEILSSVELGANGIGADKALQVTVPSSSANQAAQKQSFQFDRVFGPASSQDGVYTEVSELVQSALDGKRVCIFAYGQTGSGKTYTMMGDPGNQGIIPRAIQQVFASSQAMEAEGWQFSMTASMMEIYNEEYRDLLHRRRSAEPPKKHQVVHDPQGNTLVSDLTLVDVTTAERVGELLREAMDKRSVGSTQLNEQSSRSHMVFTLRIEGRSGRSGDKVQGVLNLIDLAGSERVKDSGAAGTRLKEAQAINKSLSALGDVIVSLAQKAEHIPYRNSKLTWLLQPCLGGDAKTLMFVNINPTFEFAQESLCSLRFAHKVNSVILNKDQRRLPK